MGKNFRNFRKKARNFRHFFEIRYKKRKKSDPFLLSTFKPFDLPLLMKLIYFTKLNYLLILSSMKSLIDKAFNL